MTETEGPSALVTGASALVSGATGFLGGHLALALKRRGYRVSALARPGRDASALQAQGITIVTGDLNDPASLVRATAGHPLVFHTAGMVTDWGPSDEFRQTNVDGTLNVIAACRQTGVRRLLYVSSLSVLGLPRSGRQVDEETPVVFRAKDPYTASKIAAERLVRNAHGQDNLETVVVRPGVIWGAGDTSFLPRFARLLHGRRMVLVGKGQNHIALSHVDNLTQGIIQAAESAAAAGGLYHLTDGEEITAKEAFAALAEALNAPPPRISLPFPLVYALASLMEFAARLRRQSTPPPFTRYGVRLVSSDNRYDIRKARRELGYHPEVTFRQGVFSLAGTGAGR